MNNLFTQNIAEISISYSTKVKARDRVQITRSGAAFEILKECFPSLEHREYFYMMLLDRGNKVLGVHQVSAGGVTGTVVDPKIVFQVALKSNACSIILAHNHPSGGIQPSEADITLTRKLKNAGEFLDITVIDHLIVTEDIYYSFADEGRL